MKYKDIIEALTPYANEDVDALMDDSLNEVSFWIDEGGVEIIYFPVHE